MESLTTPAGKGERRLVLDPTERFSEILFGLIMVLTFTGSLSASSSGLYVFNPGWETPTVVSSLAISF